MSMNVCIPVLRRYDLLMDLVASLQASSLQPSGIWVINNGTATIHSRGIVKVHVPEKPMGVAESWNWFLDNVPEDRVITNDDIVFAPQSLAVLAGTPGDMVLGFGFSCFLIRDTCVEKIGRFDEEISPGYAYYEDCDYMARIHKECDEGRHVSLVNSVGSGLVHGRDGEGSQTSRAGTQQEINEHWRRFNIAKANFIRKWGAEPHILDAQRAAKMAEAKAVTA